MGPKAPHIFYIDEFSFHLFTGLLGGVDNYNPCLGRPEFFSQVLAKSRSASPGLGCAISQFERLGSSSEHAEIGPESFGIVVCRSVGTVPGVGLAQL